MRAGSPRIQSLDGLRGIAALSVVLFHFNFMYLPQARIYEMVPLSRAYLSVDLFFILSGFIMAHVYGDMLATDWRNAWRPFLVARIARLYPLFMTTLAFLFVVVVFCHVRSRYVSFSISSLALQPLMLQPLHYGLNWDYPSWSIGTEMSAYVLFVLFAKFLLRGQRPYLTALTSILLAAAFCWLKDGKFSSGAQAPAYIRTYIGFTLGVLVYRAYMSSQRRCRIWGMVAIGPSYFLAWHTGYDVFATIGFAATIAVCGTDRAVIRCILDSRPLRSLGDWSYGIYLWHAPVHFAVAAIIAAFGLSVASLDRAGSLWLTLATLILVISLSAFTHQWFEVPVRRVVTEHLNRWLAPTGDKRRPVVQ